ncbi:glycosyltransferase family 69 protein [Atractiella rhizophila]|nr:glycosyltransferase family 69 protein [Atractiella rhizophila]
MRSAKSALFRVFVLILALGSLVYLKLVHQSRSTVSPTSSSAPDLPRSYLEGISSDLSSYPTFSKWIDDGLMPVNLDGVPETMQGEELFSLLRLLSGAGIPNNCQLRSDHLSRYAPLRGTTSPVQNSFNVFDLFRPTRKRMKLSQRYFLASALHSSHVLPLLPTFAHSISTLARYLGPERVYLSLLVSSAALSSSNDQTVEESLLLLAKIMERTGVGHSIVLSSSSNLTVASNAPNHRIESLAAIRNAVLSPLFSLPTSSQWKEADVLFLNDIFHCPHDLLELLYQKKTEKADMMCGMDYAPLEIDAFAPDYPILFYDMWVARDMLGLPFYRIKEGGHWDLPSNVQPLEQQNPNAHSSYVVLEPFQVFSCWNGVVAFSADILFPSSTPTSLSTKERNKGDSTCIRFRADSSGDRLSECTLFSMDLWKSGRGRIGVTPRVRVAYEMGTYERVRTDGQPFYLDSEWELQRHLEGKGKIEWKNWPPKLVVQYPWGRWEQELWEPPWEDS